MTLGFDEKINGVNLGNWLVLEKWMSPKLFDACGEEDEIWMHRTMDQDSLQALLKKHRDTYMTLDDFRAIAAHGYNLVRIPVPYFIFGDLEGHPGCIDYLDKAFEWASQTGLQVLIDLHTVPGSQNGYDNGGITGVCKWYKNPKAVEYSLTVLERLAERYRDEPMLYGIEVVNEPISWLVYVTAPSTGHAKDKQEAQGSSFVPMKFLKPFYREAYRRLRAKLHDKHVIVFHDGFRPNRWRDWFVREGMKNVILDTHIYIYAMETFVPIHAMWLYKLFIKYNEWIIRRAAKYTPMVVGEWNVVNMLALKKGDKAKAAGGDKEAAKCRVYQEVGKLELPAWQSSAGHIYWNYQLVRHNDEAPLDFRNGGDLEAWDLTHAWSHGWMDANRR